MNVIAHNVDFVDTNSNDGFNNSVDASVIELANEPSVDNDVLLRRHDPFATTLGFIFDEEDFNNPFYASKEFESWYMDELTKGALDYIYVNRPSHSEIAPLGDDNVNVYPQAIDPSLIYCKSQSPSGNDEGNATLFWEDISVCIFQPLFHIIHTQTANPKVDLTLNNDVSRRPATPIIQVVDEPVSLSHVDATDINDIAQLQRPGDDYDTEDCVSASSGDSVEEIEAADVVRHF